MKKLLICLLCCSCLLTGCSLKFDMESGNISEEPKKTKIPANAITAVVTDAEQGIDGSVIQLSDFEIELPKGYVYGKKEYKKGEKDTTPNSTIYYVWKKTDDKDYVLETDTNIMLYIYEGLDDNTPHKELTVGQALSSMKTVYMNQFATMVTLKNRTYDPMANENNDKSYYVWQYKGNSGQSITTSYGEVCFPKTYYGIMGVQSKTQDGKRKFYSFIFSNDGTGEFWKKSQYDNFIAQMKNGLNYSTFNGEMYGKKNIDISNGFTYENLVNEVLFERSTGKKETGIFYNSLLYYVAETGRSYERINID